MGRTALADNNIAPETLIDCVGMLDGVWLTRAEATQLIGDAGSREEVLANLILRPEGFARVPVVQSVLRTLGAAAALPTTSEAVDIVAPPRIEHPLLPRSDFEALVAKYAEDPAEADPLIRLGALRPAIRS